ncbi:MAG: serine/threonine protein kinase [Pirellulales bacterium]
MIDKLGPYRIERLLGRGGMGTVYAGVHEETGHRAALKALSFALIDDPSFRSRFIAEIETLKKLRHPNIVELYGDGEQDGNLYYVMELVEGRTLQDDLQSGHCFEWSEVVAIAIEVCQALKHAHDRGVVHRDLKPANLLRSPDGQIKLSDFGIAKLFGGAHLTAAGSVVGTADYMAPEQAEGRPVTHRTDLYSLGTVMYALLARRPPFVGPSLPQVIHKLRYEQPAAVRRYVPQVPVELEEMIGQLLSKNPEDRVPTALALANRLSALQHGLLRAGDSVTAPKEPDVAPADPSGDDEATRVVETRPGPPTEVGPTAIATGDPRLPVDADTSDRATIVTSKETGHFTPVKASASTVADEPPAPRDRFTPIGDLEQTAVEETREVRPSSVRDKLQTTGMIVALFAIIGITVWGFWPPSADTLYEQIVRISREEGPEPAKDDIERFLDRFPQDPRYPEVDALGMDVECAWLQARLALRDLKSGGTKLTPGERDLLAAMRLQTQHLEAARETLEALIVTYENSEEPTETTTICLDAARHLLSRITREEKGVRNLFPLRKSIQESNREEKGS